jgi:beta-galactosidase
MKVINDGWLFAKDKPENFLPVSLPHDWLIYDVNKLYESGLGWYQRELDTGFIAEGQRVFLHFDGVYMDSTLYVNGSKVGEWKYGYTAFEFDITDYLSPSGKNTLLLKVNYQAPNSRWYSGAGIYRDVILKVKNPCHFITDGIYITTSYREGRWHYEVDAEVTTGGKPYELKHTLLEPVDAITAWEPDQPRLYTLRSELIVDGEVTDTADTRFGFRTIEFTTDRGFFLNGKHMKLKGVCLHHDLGALGAAVHKDAIRRQLTLLKQMGVNAIRTAHNPPAKCFMELADEMGFMVLHELLDMWKAPKTPYDYARFFEEWVERDAASWIRRDRNHPCVILWSVGNEIHDTHADAVSGAETLRKLMALVRKHDPKGHAPATLCSNYMPWENTQKCADIIKLMGYNYAESLYSDHHRAHPDWIIYGSETCSTVQSRGIYHFPLSKSILADDDLQCSSLGNSSTSWGAKSVEDCIITDRDIPYSLGQFIWAGQDYIGEPTPYHTKNSYFGQLDTAGFPKDSYYVFQAAWTDYKKAPMIHLFPYWDFSPDQLIDVRVCSNAPSVELFFNDQSLGRVDLKNRYIADWQLPYAPGILRALAYDEQGAVIANDQQQSFTDVEKLQIESEQYGELVFYTITAIDKAGHTVENANCRVKVAVEEGELLGLDNGDSTDYDQYKGNSKRLFSGKLLAIVKKSRSGAAPKITAELDRQDIPIRKIELLREGYQIRAVIHPENATYQDLLWRLTDAGGIDSPLGSLMVAPDGKSATLHPKGDGEVFIRCCAKNGRDHISLISQISIAISGLGTCFTDPYSFVSAGLYTHSNVELTNGNERGVATARDGASYVGFANLDFGSYGSDELTLPLFPLSPDPFEFEIWEGMPDDQGSKLGTYLYDKGSIWNTYQELTCKLPRRLKGVTTLCLVFHGKVHIKGFQFTRYQKAFRKLYAAECDVLYGDTYQVSGMAVEQIGNNVSLIYKDMDFGCKGAGKIRICWRSVLPCNSIQFVFTGEDGEEDIRRMIEVPASKDYRDEEFDLGSRIKGRKTVSLIFLPGCKLDLECIQFIEDKN